MDRRGALLGLLASAGCARAPRAGTAGVTPAAIGRRAADDYLGRAEFMRYDVDPVHAVHYADVAAAYGVARLAAATGDSALLAGVAARHDRLIAAALPNTENHVDANVYGVWPLELARKGGGGELLARGLAMADGQWRETTPDGLTSQARYWIDDVWMIGALQVQAWRATYRRRYIDRAALMARRYLARLQQPNGLFHHGPNAPFFWARGNGWVAAGLAEILADLPRNHPDRVAIASGYRRMMAALLAHQAASGMWRQLIDREDSWEESSATAMFGFAMQSGARHALLDRTYAEAAKRAWTALAAHVGPDGRLAEICVGTGQSKDPAYYLARPRVTGDLHGQAALLWFAAAMA